jgi:hypothetical protein
VSSSSWFVRRKPAALWLLLLTALLSLISPVSQAFAATPSACFANFDSGGSVLRGTTYSSFEEYPGVRKRAATDALTQALTKRSFTILSSDDASGSLTAAGTIGGRESQTVTFSVMPMPGGVRLSFQHRLGIGTHGRDDRIQEDLCHVLGEVLPIIRQRILDAPAPAPAPAPGDAVALGQKVVVEGRYLRKGRPTDYLELNAGRFTTRQSSQTVSGTYELQGDKLILTTPAMAVPAVGRFISKDSIRDGEGAVWEREAVLTNDEVVSLVKVDLGDEIVIAKIKNAPKVQLDVSTDALVTLKKSRVSSPVIAAMIERAARQSTTTSAASPDPAQSRPAESAAPVVKAPPNPCADIELMGLLKEDMRPMSPLIIYIAQARNTSNVARVVRLQWLDMYGQAMQSTIQIGGGQITKVQLAAQEPFQRQPVELRIASCQ